MVPHRSDDVADWPSGAQVSAAVFRSADEFRPFRIVVDGFAVPLGSAFAGAGRAVYELAAGTVAILRTFPRIMEARIATAGPVMIVPMEDAVEFIANGVHCDQHTILMLRSSLTLHCVERRANLLAVVCLAPSSLALHWRATDDTLVFFRARADAIASLREALPDGPHRPGESAGALLHTIEGALASAEIFGRDTAKTRARYIDIVERLDRYLAERWSKPIRNEDVARSLGIPVRTMHQAMSAIRGMGPKRYIRLRRLWSARRQLFASAAQAKVKPIALANGFRHLGEFSAAYRGAFGETPSATVARSRASG